MRKLDLKTAVSEITQELESVSRASESPFFFVVGAGVSNPPVPLASTVEEHCKTIALKYGRTDKPNLDSAIERYSHWFQQAYPQPRARQSYLRRLIEQAYISDATFRLAHLMAGSAVTNVVVTPNFDDFLSRALTLFGRRHVVCDHPRTLERVDQRSPDPQIVHIHGSYWFYDCCNLTEEIVARAQPSASTSFTMAQWLDGLLWSRSPLLVGYSGWEGDVLMSSLRRRLSTGLGTNLYWFC